ncbi:EAL domain-containing protein [Azospirillum sp. TSO22-1]|uniref:putative bifunctional diguanylate cyclase/phosphodiesterase n=1 Tax=Azospirillum sp. TSO22-1 TaxID=716789 RepID=UPI000D6542B8|nr:EAL domain-containing protein [Azospirillum sp. TSO22-1]
MDDALPMPIDRAELGRRLVEAAGDAILVVDAQGVVLDCNPAASELFRCPAAAIVGRHISGELSPERQPDGRPSLEVAAEVGRLVQAGHRQQIEWTYRRADGSLVETEVTLAPVQTGEDGFRIVIARDISARKAMENRMLQSEQKFAQLFAISPDPMIVAEIDTGRILDVNLSFVTGFGYAREEVLGRSTVEIGLWVDPSQRAATVEVMRRRGQLRNHEVDFRTTRGEVVTVLGSSAEVQIDGRSCWLVQFKDITERKAHLAMVEFLAHHDSLTGMPNRKRLHEVARQRIADAQEGAQEGQRAFALLLIDLDRFKEVNDTLGHHVGDELLRMVSARLVEVVADRDGFAARLGGDEFAVVLPGAGPEEAKGWALEFLTALRRPFTLEGMRLDVGASIGIAVYPQDGRDSSTLLRCADVAMYVAKRKQTGWSHYMAQADTHSASRLALMADLGDAIRSGQLLLHYQPILRVEDGTTVGAEALVRWQHPHFGLIPPGEFVPMAEMSDLIHAMTAWVLDAAVAQAEAWRAGALQAGGRPWRIAVNLSARNLIDESLPDQVRATLERHGLPPRLLELEITETAMMADPDRALAVLGRISALGVEIAIDDFGTGYSSFATLRRLPPIASLKIDQSFVRRMLCDPADAVVVQTMVSLARNLGTRAIAEGVECADLLEALRRCGCAEAQGYAIARPMTADALERWAAERDGG